MSDEFKDVTVDIDIYDEEKQKEIETAIWEHVQSSVTGDFDSMELQRLQEQSSDSYRFRVALWWNSNPVSGLSGTVEKENGSWEVEPDPSMIDKIKSFFN